MKVNNLPSNYNEFEWITVRKFDDEFWYYGAWKNDYDGAISQANEIDGYVMNSNQIERA